MYLNEDGDFFHDSAERAGLGVNQLLGWGAAFLDIDEDMHPDLILANGHFYPEVDRARLGETYRQPTLLYRNLGNGKFADVTKQAGAALSSPKASRGLAIGDLDGDARPEIVLGTLIGGMLLKATSQADVRQWEMLPRTVFVLPLELAPGTHDISVEFPAVPGVSQEWRRLIVPPEGQEATYYFRMQRGNPGPFYWPPPAVARGEAGPPPIP